MGFGDFDQDSLLIWWSVVKLDFAAWVALEELGEPFTGCCTQSRCFGPSISKVRIHERNDRLNAKRNPKGRSTLPSLPTTTLKSCEYKSRCEAKYEVGVH